MISKRVHLDQDLQVLATWGVEALNAVIAIDSQSDERNQALPSSEGQRELSAYLQTFFERLGYKPEIDTFANLLVPIPSNLPDASVPMIALMAHLDTAQGTQAIPQLCETPAWDGRPVAFTANPRLQVSAEEYPQTRIFLGEDLLHGHGDAPVGLDDKLGMAQLMTLARVLAENPAISHGDLLLVFRPDEEIGRMEVIEGLAAQLAARGVKFGYTADGLDPFEVNVENFNASRARVAFQGQPVTFHAQVARRIDFLLHGVKSHGATAKAEGYRNAIRLVCDILHKVPRDAVFPLRFQSDVTSEVNATLSLLLHGASDAALDLAEQSVCTALETAFSPLQKRGASWEITARLAVDPNSPYTDEIAQTLQFVDAFLRSQHAPTPLLSEDSEGFQGYTNPYFIDHKSPHATLDLRIRDFSPEQCKVREEHVRSVVSQHPHVTVEIAQQYINMGPALAPFPELLTWAQEAARSIEQTAPRLPIRGGTGVDPFLAHGIPVANLGTGYFAPESEKELTSRQSLARHILWHVQLVHHIATHFASQS